MQKESKKPGVIATDYEKPAISGFHIEVDKVINGLSVCINGVISVLDFGEECAVLRVRRGKIRVEGSALSISVYENKTAEISGKVGKIEFI